MFARSGCLESCPEVLPGVGVDQNGIVAAGGVKP